MMQGQEVERSQLYLGMPENFPAVSLMKFSERCLFILKRQACIIIIIIIIIEPEHDNNQQNDLCAQQKLRSASSEFSLCAL